MLSIYSEEQYAVRVLRAGASGYLTKESAPGELKEAIRRVAQGRKYITSSLAEKLAFELDADPKKQHPAHPLCLKTSPCRLISIAYCVTSQ